jgi:hypothetical protein
LAPAPFPAVEQERLRVGVPLVRELRDAATDHTGEEADAAALAGPDSPPLAVWSEDGPGGAVMTVRNTDTGGDGAGDRPIGRGGRSGGNTRNPGRFGMGGSVPGLVDKRAAGRRSGRGGGSHPVGGAAASAAGPGPIGPRPGGPVVPLRAAGPRPEVDGGFVRAQRIGRSAVARRRGAGGRGEIPQPPAGRAGRRRVVPGGKPPVPRRASDRVLGGGFRRTGPRGPRRGPPGGHGGKTRRAFSPGGTSRPFSGFC